MSRLSLRARLVLVVLVVLSAGLVVADVATSTALRSYLLERIDEQLDRAEPFVLGRYGGAPVGNPFDRRPPSGDVRSARITADNQIVERVQGPFVQTELAFDQVPAGAVTAARSGARVRFEVTIDDVRWRGLATPIPSTGGDIAVLLTPLGDVNETLSRLVTVEIVVTAVLLVGAGGLALWLVRVGLRPLARMADTAGAIAAGDIHQRIEPGGGTEVARLGSALNEAFDARQASEDTLRTFVADASHELRTPLTSIRGYAELLRTGAVSGPDDVGRAVGRIEGEAARMGELVEDLLVLARLDQGRPLVHERLDLSELAADAVGDAAVADPAREYSLVAPGPVVLDGDEGRLRQVLANLLSNVSDHTPPGTAAEVRVTSDGSTARVAVTDEGPGLSEEAAAHLFDRFWRADPAHGHTAGAAGGSGLGLSIVAAIAEAHGGRAFVEPAPGHGARLVVELPQNRPT